MKTQFKKLSYEKESQILKYPINTKVSFKPSYWVQSEGIIVNYTDSSKQVAQIRELETLDIYHRSLEHLELYN